MDDPFVVLDPDAPNGLSYWTVSANDAPSLEAKLATLLAGIVATQNEFVILGVDLGAAGDGGLFQATLTGATVGGAQTNAVQINAAEARLFALDTSGDGDAVPFATGDAEFAPSGERLQKRIFDAAAAEGATATCYGLKSAGCNAGRRLVLLSLCAFILPPG